MLFFKNKSTDIQYNAQTFSLKVSLDEVQIVYEQQQITKYFARLLQK